MSLGRQPQENEQMIFDGDQLDSNIEEKTNGHNNVDNYHNDGYDQQIDGDQENNNSNYEEEKDQYQGVNNNNERFPQDNLSQGILLLDQQNNFARLDNLQARNMNNQAQFQVSLMGNQRKGIMQQLTLKGIPERSQEQCNSNNSSSENKRSFSQNHGNTREQQTIVNNIDQEINDFKFNNTQDIGNERNNNDYQVNDKLLQDQYTKDDDYEGQQWNQGNNNNTINKNIYLNWQVRSSSYDNYPLNKNPKYFLNKNNSNINNYEAQYTGSFNEHINDDNSNNKLKNFSNPYSYPSELSSMSRQKENVTNQRNKQESEKYQTHGIQRINHDYNFGNETNGNGNLIIGNDNINRKSSSSHSYQETQRKYNISDSIRMKLNNINQKNESNTNGISKSYANAMRALQERIRQLEKQAIIDNNLHHDIQQQHKVQTEQLQLEISMRVQESQEQIIRIEELEGELIESRSETLELSKLFDQNAQEKAELFNSMENEILELKKELLRSQQTQQNESQEKNQVAQEYDRQINETDELKRQIRQHKSQQDEQIRQYNDIQTKLVYEISQKESLSIRIDKISRESEKQRQQNNEQLRGFQNELFNLEQEYLNKIKLLEEKCCRFNDDAEKDKQQIFILQRDLRDSQEQLKEQRQNYEERIKKMIKEQRYLKQQIDQLKQIRAQQEDDGDDDDEDDDDDQGCDERKDRKRTKRLENIDDARAGRSVSFKGSYDNDEKNELKVISEGISRNDNIEGNYHQRLLTPDAKTQGNNQKYINSNNKNRQDSLITSQYSQTQVNYGLSQSLQGSDNLVNSQNSKIIIQQQYDQSHSKQYQISGDKRVNARNTNANSLNGYSQQYQYQSQQPSNNVSYSQVSYPVNQNDNEKYEYVLKQIIEAEKIALMLSNQFQQLLTESTVIRNYIMPFFVLSWLFQYYDI